MALAASDGGAADRLRLFEEVSMAAPPGTAARPGAGTDSRIASVTGPGFSCEAEAGLHAPRPAPEGAVSVPTTVSGRAAELIAAPGGVEALHAPRIASSALGPVRLTIACRADGPAARAAVRAMLRSVRVE